MTDTAVFTEALIAALPDEDAPAKPAPAEAKAAVRTPEEEKQFGEALASVHKRFGRAMKRLSE